MNSMRRTIGALSLSSELAILQEYSNITHDKGAIQEARARAQAAIAGENFACDKIMHYLELSQGQTWQSVRDDFRARSRRSGKETHA
jgi:hypothetical protein